MSQNHSVTKRKRRNKSGKRGHPGQATQWALRSIETMTTAFNQEEELAYSLAKDRAAALLRRAAKAIKRGQNAG